MGVATHERTHQMAVPTQAEHGLSSGCMLVLVTVAAVKCSADSQLHRWRPT